MQPVLVVDDDPGIRTVLAEALEDDGFTVSTAANGREALRCIGVEEPQLLLLDVQMPVMDGPELISTLRQARFTMPVVMMSADQQARATSVRCHADAFLAKPFNLDDVLAVVEDLTSRSN